jgi:drug/metabolite transporter (DMT)-like permease
MVSLLVHAILGIAVIALVVKSNPAIFKRFPSGSQVSALEIVFYVVGFASIPLCWYFNVRYVQEYSDNPFWGQATWTEFIKLGYANPAASSASADYTIGNVILLPLFTIIDGRRRGIHRPWLFFVASLFTSFAFAWAFYLATVERQRRHQQSAVAVESRA